MAKPMPCRPTTFSCGPTQTNFIRVGWRCWVSAEYMAVNWLR